MPHQDGFGDNGPEATGLSKPDDGDDGMQKKSENIAHAYVLPIRTCLFILFRVSDFGEGVGVGDGITDTPNRARRWKRRK
jgi:hypothetical protein